MTAKQRKDLKSIMKIICVILSVIIVNVMIAFLPAGLKKIDVSPENILVFDKNTKTYLSKLNDSIVITVFAEKETADRRIVGFIETYQELSKKIVTQWVNPSENVALFKETGLSENSVLISDLDTKRSKVIPFDKILVPDVYRRYMYQDTQYIGFDGEGQFNSAVEYVVSGKTYKLSYTMNHGEEALADETRNDLEKSHITLNKTDLQDASALENSDGLLLYKIKSDLSYEEYTVITSYLDHGGYVVVIPSGDKKDFKWMNQLMEDYGLEFTENYIEDHTNYYPGGNSYYSLLPSMDLTSEYLKDISGSESVLFLDTVGLREISHSKEIQVEPFLRTSADASEYNSDGKVMKETFILAAVSHKQISDQVKSSVVMYASDGFLTESVLSEAGRSLANLGILRNSLTRSCDEDSKVYVEMKDLEYSRSNMIKDINLWSFVVVLLIPGLVLVGGSTYWYKRKISGSMKRTGREGNNE